MDQQHYNRSFSNNADAVSTSSLKLRLDTNNLMKKVEVFLRGEITESYIDEELQEIKTRVVKVGLPKANKKGVQYLMLWMQTKFNSHTTQGNIDDKQYGSFLRRCRIGLAQALMINLINFGIKESDYTSIIDVLMESLELYISSTVEGFFTKNLTPTLRTVESNTIREEPKKKFGIL